MNRQTTLLQVNINPKDALTINLEHFELLGDPTNYPLLRLLETPHTPSKAAKSFGLAPNALHHRFKKLAEAKLIKEVSHKGNRCSYQVVAIEMARSENKPYLFAFLKSRMTFANHKPAMFIREVELTAKQYSELADVIRDFLREALETNRSTNSIQKLVRLLILLAKVVH
ncbi:MAG: winged helix-turn-helix domain-containing protein [Trueperaceae bacterium]